MTVRFSNIAKSLDKSTYKPLFKSFLERYRIKRATHTFIIQSFNRGDNRRFL